MEILLEAHTHQGNLYDTISRDNNSKYRYENCHVPSFISSCELRIHQTSTLFPYTTLFRSGCEVVQSLAGSWQWFSWQVGWNRGRNEARRRAYVNCSETVSLYAVITVTRTGTTSTQPIAG